MKSDVGQLLRELDEGWLNLDEISTVEVTSEHASFPVESALRSNAGSGWRASQKGEQQIRIIFDQPKSLHCIHLRFDESDSARTQEFVIRSWCAAGGRPKEIVRQQWNFSPAGSTIEVEDYTVELNAVTLLELAIKPDLGRGEAVASLTACRLG
jgi:XRCC1 domain-containing protein